jgi:hypothetical protein
VTRGLRVGRQAETTAPHISATVQINPSTSVPVLYVSLIYRWNTDVKAAVGGEELHPTCSIFNINLGKINDPNNTESRDTV